MKEKRRGNDLSDESPNMCQGLFVPGNLPSIKHNACQIVCSTKDQKKIKVNPQLPTTVATLYPRLVREEHQKVVETYVNDQVRPCHKGGGIGCKKNSNAVQLVHVSKTVHRGARTPHFLLGLKGRNTVQGGICIKVSENFPNCNDWVLTHVTRGDGI